MYKDEAYEFCKEIVAKSVDSTEIGSVEVLKSVEYEEKEGNICLLQTEE